MPRDYFQLRPDGLRWLAYPDRYVFELVQDIDDFNCNQRLTEEDQTRLFSAMMTGADLVYPLDSHRLTWLMWRLLDCWQDNLDSDCGIYYDEDDEEDDDMGNRTQYQKFDGVWFVGFPCGPCGEVEWVELGRGVPIGVGGGPELPGDDNYFDGGNVATGDTASCYASGAVELVTARLKDFYDLVTDIVGQGVDVASGSADEVVNVFLLAAQILSGNADISSIEEFSKAQFDEAIDDPVVQANLKAAWTFDAAVTRQNLKQWAQSGGTVSVTGGNFPVSTVIDVWATFVNVRRLNDELSVRLADCEATVESETPFFNAGLISGESYYLATVGLAQLQSGNTRTVRIPDGGIVVGWAWFNQAREFVPPGALCNVETTLGIGGTTTAPIGAAEFIDNGFYIQLTSAAPPLADVQAAFPSIAGASTAGAAALTATDGDFTWLWETSGGSCNPGDVFQAEQSISAIVRGTPPNGS